MEKNESSSKPEKRERRKRSRKANSKQVNKDAGSEKSMNLGLAAEISSLKDDITTVTSANNAEKGDSILVTKANKIPLPIKHRNDVEGARQKKPTENVYVEKHLGFRTEPLTHFERRLTEKQNVLHTEARQQMQLKQNNPGLSFALNVHGAIDRLGRTMTGLFGGAALVHTLFVQSFRFSRRVQNNGVIQYNADNGLQFLMRYGLHAEAVYIAYYIAFIFTGLFVFERFDIGRPTNKCITQCITLANGGISLLFHVCAFIISNAMQWLSYTIHTSANANEENLDNLLTSAPELTRWINIWLILDICRTVFLIASWIFIGFSNQNLDRTRETLFDNFITDDKRVGQNNSDVENVWQFTETVKTSP
ncbi:hypothetical protein FGIG_09166 [Fasciola gigantica]|uniref:Transmembrane protein n=1 Tax=Fasciola gigantica TaxID=46835 RepID=A0A504YVB2_FASGI|nr:hypothetical protein FGIG_09166 [Fasciola gigantica]